MREFFLAASKRMDVAALVPTWLDAFLIAPFRWPGSAHAGLWLGAAFLALYCLILGELTGAGLFFMHRNHYDSMHDSMLRHHNISVDALHAGDKEAYLAANKLAQEDFGKTFFAQASIGLSTLWPVPLALAWMSLRFEGIALYAIPGTGIQAGYVFVLLFLYILLRVLFARQKKRLPLFRRIEALKEQRKRLRPPARSFLR